MRWNQKNINFIRRLARKWAYIKNLITMNINNFGQALSYEEKGESYMNY